MLCADDGENLEELPIARTIRTKKAIMIEAVEEQKEEIQFALDERNLAAKFSPSVPKPDKKGKILLSPEKFKTIRRQVVADQTKEKELRSEYPQLEVCVDEGAVRLNGANMNLSPTQEEVAHDVSLHFLSSKRLSPEINLKLLCWRKRMQKYSKKFPTKLKRQQTFTAKKLMHCLAITDTSLQQTSLKMHYPMVVRIT